MSILTLARYKELTNTSVVTNDTLIGYLMPVVQEMIESYCDRAFDNTSYYQWFHFTGDRTIVLPEYPVNNIVYLGYPSKVATVAYTTGSYNIEVTKTGVTITNDADLTYNTYAFSPNNTLDKLRIEIEDDFGPNMTVTIESGYTAYNSYLLQTGTGKEWNGAIRLDAQARLQDRSDRVIELAYNSAFVMNYATDYVFNDELYVIWKAGYEYADMPKNLQMIEAMIIRDYLNLITLKINSLVKSQTITNYSITYVDNALLMNIIDGYSSQLNDFKKKIL